jgi:hypothetical protein
MAKQPWKPWHEVVALRDDLKTGKLTLAMFAADLYDVVMGKARPAYQDPSEFFGLTYPTHNLRELVKDVLIRLAGKSEKAVRQLELTYGGGKTHTLVTLYHLVHDPKALPKMAAVEEFLTHAGIKPPKTRVAVLPFDKLDVEKGMEILDPKGNAHWLKQPWSVLAWQLAGPKGLKLLHPDGKAEERESAPAENLMRDLLALPAQEGLATLILIDEVLMYAREKAGLDQVWRGRLQNFFQYLTQAATKVDSCAIVASLLATDTKKSDTLGREIMQELSAIFNREREEGIQPVTKDDVAEVLRRRMFKPESIKDTSTFRPHVVAALKGIAALDDQTAKAGKIAEDRYFASYPFHPDMTDVLYAKWTNLPNFQRTRGILRTFALALRDASKWDASPLIGPNVFLSDQATNPISEGLQELISVATNADPEGKKPDWAGIMTGELDKARAIQQEIPGLGCRELEQAVISTFLHSQPIGQRALATELVTLIGHTRPDKIVLEKALSKWTEISWFLDEAAIGEAEKKADGSTQLPKVWRLGPEPNLRQMHHEACRRIQPDIVESRLLDEIGKLKDLTSGASSSGAHVHTLPQKPKDVDDDGEFHFVVLGPPAASESGKPSSLARKFIDETTAPDRPRVYRNAIVLAVPSQNGLEVVRGRIRDHIGWEEVSQQLMPKNKEDQSKLDPIRMQRLTTELSRARRQVPASIEEAYSIVVTVSEANEVHAFKVAVGDAPLFQTIKADGKSRIQDTPVTAEALLPDGPYNLWRKGETSRRVKDLVGAFAQFPHLPKMLNRKAIMDTLIEGCEQGTFVLRLTRPDRSVRTFWRERPDDSAQKDASLELVLPDAAEITILPHQLLIPGRLPMLWQHPKLKNSELAEYFAGSKVVKVKREGYEEPVTIPKAGEPVLTEAVTKAVEAGILWLTSGPASILSEPIPAGVLNADGVLQLPPVPVPAIEILPDALPAAWAGEVTTAMAILTALSQKAGVNLPWITVRTAIDGALSARFLELAEDSGPWPCDISGANAVKLQVPSKIPPPPPPPPPKPGVVVAEAELTPSEIQNLAEQVGALTKAAAGQEIKYRLRIEFGGAKRPTDDYIKKVKGILKEVSDKLELK